MKIPNFSEKLKTILEERGMTQEQLAEAAGMTGRHLSRTKGAEDIPESFMRKICGALDLDLSDFSKSAPASDFFPVPIREAGGGMGGGYHNSSKKIISHISLRRDFLLSKTSRLDSLSFIHASGESMSPTIPPDAMVLIDESQIEPVNKKIFYVMLNNSFFIKRLEVKGGNVTAIISDNGDKREEIGAQDNFQIIGRAILQQTLL